MKKYSKLILTGIIIVALVVVIWGVQLSWQIKVLNQRLSEADHKVSQYELYNEQLTEELEAYSLMEEAFEESESQLEDMTDLYQATLEEKEALEDSIQESSLGEIGRYFFADFPDYDYGLIAEDLRQHPELIGMHAVLGGVMQFGEIRLISDRLVYASFSDGHILGEGIYSYRIGSNGAWQWQRIIEYPDTWNPNLRAYIGQGRVPSLGDYNDDLVSTSTTLKQLLSHYSETVDGAYAENYASSLYHFYKVMPIENYLVTLSEAGPLTQEGAISLLSYEVISMGDMDGIGVDYLAAILDEMGTKGALDQTFVDNFLEILETTKASVNGN